MMSLILHSLFLWVKVLKLFRLILSLVILSSMEQLNYGFSYAIDSYLEQDIESNMDNNEESLGHSVLFDDCFIS